MKKHSQPGNKQEIDQDFNLFIEAHKVIQAASSKSGIQASAQAKDNYNRIWARDSAVTGLAILTGQIKESYSALSTSLFLLQKAAATNGQIPSNLTVNERGEITQVSFGGPVGRTDASFWWIISSILYQRQHQDAGFRTIIELQSEAIFALATGWEFNGKGLMYVPMSSNWADEYITHGYVLYDQILRYWALDLAGDYFDKYEWKEKAAGIKASIKQHFLFETGLEETLYTESQRRSLTDFDLSKRFIASFSPGDRVEKYDAWSIALLFLLDIPSGATKKQLTAAILSAFEETGQKGVPAFWPEITETEPQYDILKQNYNYQFKNLPGHFHNGGVWPVVNGFLIAGLKVAGEDEAADKLMTGLNQQLSLSLEKTPFTEYFDSKHGKACGVINLCYSASGYLLGVSAIDNLSQFKKDLGLSTYQTEEVSKLFINAARNILDCFSTDSSNIIAISISGESGCGKTTLSLAIREALNVRGITALILHQDDYFKLPPASNHEMRLCDFSHIGPQEVMLDLLDEHIRQVKVRRKASILVPYMDLGNDIKKEREIDIKGVTVLLIEGTYTTLLKNVDHHVFINTTYKQTRNNRIKRNREVVTDFIEKVLEKESSIIQKQKESAHIILDKQLQIIHPGFTYTQLLPVIKKYRS
ncbi:MAG: hypothetical protein H7Y07_09140 [Pyrinomonadaceae bacterium]|nr:hypothetical protein [Sphingobacteriaceae bacterium]